MVAAHEIMVGLPAIRNLIREDKIAQMYSVIQTGAAHGMQTMDQCLLNLVNRGLITKQDALAKAQEQKRLWCYGADLGVVVMDLLRTAAKNGWMPRHRTCL